jgi:hypothetical protein
VPHFIGQTRGHTRYQITVLEEEGLQITTQDAAELTQRLRASDLLALLDNEPDMS